jgi:nicotinate-nucleotide adenylyltransferase
MAGTLERRAKERAMSEAEQIGLYGGSFDPMHNGHLAVAEEARVVLGLARVLIIPAARQPLKSQAQGATAEHRLAMARLACGENAAFVVDDVELRRPPPSYTIDTLLALRERLGAEVKLWFILGADAAAELPRWHRASELLTLVRLCIVGRPGFTLDLRVLEADLPALAGRYRTIEGPQLEISSSELRRRCAAGLPIRYQLPESVREYIETRRLYSDE